MANPFHRMLMLDKRGDTYWLEHVTLTSGKVFPFADIISVDEHWMCCRCEVGDKLVETYISIEHIISLQIKTR